MTTGPEPLTPEPLTTDDLGRDDLSPDGLDPDGLDPDGLNPDGLDRDDLDPDDLEPDDLASVHVTPEPRTLDDLSPGERHLAALLNRTPVSASRLERLHARLADTAGTRGVMDIAYTTVDSPVGLLLLAATENGLVRVAYEVEDHDQVLQSLSDALSPRVLRAPERLGEAARQVEEYFDHRRTVFELPLDFALSRGFRRDVQRRLAEIDYGHTCSYTEVAALVGSPRAVRAVGSACATNPLPVVVPCHRVLRSDGSLGGYIGGLPAKSALLELEQAA